MNEYQIHRSQGRCEACGRALEAGAELYSAVLCEKETFLRRDYCADCWGGPPDGALGSFKTRVASKPGKRRVLVDDEVLMSFFLRLEDTEDSARADFRFVLMLILLRRRLLKYDRTLRRDGAEFWVVREVGGAATHEVRNPQLDEARITLLTSELNAILQQHVAGDDGGTESVPAGESTPG
ncbi:MAG: hypothetical protein L6Q92_11555 [Phycisphaerae bacterium]|nr:hypothetical protein [Phycisphaerae bacterium]